MGFFVLLIDLTTRLIYITFNYIQNELVFLTVTGHFCPKLLDVCYHLVNIIMLMFQIKIMSICGLALVLFSSKHSHD